MKAKARCVVAAITLLLASRWATAATVDLADWALKKDADLYGIGGTLPANVMTTGFDFGTGLGTLTTIITGAGDHFVGWFLDHEIDELANLWYNETGSASGSPSVGQTWEIDEPGFGQSGGSGPYVGDIYNHLELSDPHDSLLDNLVFTSGNDTITGPDDVSMALGWRFLLGTGDEASISLTASAVRPADGFYLTQTDPDSNASIFMYGILSSRGVTVPTPAPLLLIAPVLLGFSRIARQTQRMRVAKDDADLRQIFAKR
jgi:hypothetical protein